MTPRQIQLLRATAKCIETDFPSFAPEWLIQENKMRFGEALWLCKAIADAIRFRVDICKRFGV